MCFSEILLSITFTSFLPRWRDDLGILRRPIFEIVFRSNPLYQIHESMNCSHPIFLVAENHWKIQKNDTWGEKITSRPSPKKISSLLFPATKPA